MARLPTVGGDAGNWGEILNDYLLQSHDAEGSLRSNSVGAPQLKNQSVANAALADGTIAEAKLSSAVQTKLNAATTIANGSVTTSKLADGSVTNDKLAGAGVAEGVATLDGGAKLPESQVPDRLSESVLENTIGSAVSEATAPLDAIMTALDMRSLSDMVIASAGDSTMSPFTTGAFCRAWKELAASRWPDRPFRSFSWGKESNAYPGSPTVWQDAAIITDPGGTDENVIAAADSFSLHTGEMVGRPPEVGAGVWSGTSGAFITSDGQCIFNPAYTGGGIPGAMLSTVARATKDYAYTGDWRVSSQDTSGLQRRIRAGMNGTTGEIRLQATGGATVTVTVSKIIGGTTTVLGTFPAGTIPSNQPTAWYPFNITLDGTSLTATLNGAALGPYTLTAPEVAGMGDSFGFADNSVNAGIRGFQVRGDVTRSPVAGGPSPLGWATVYNAAVAGSTIAYQQARLAAMYPVQPDVVFIHHGHNYASGSTTPNQFLVAVDGFLAELFAIWEPCPVVISSQNPEFVATGVDAARVTRHLAIQSAIRSGARERGWGYLPVFEAFSALADGGKSNVQADGIHPVIGTGTTLQTNTIKAWLTRQSRRP